MFNFHVRLVVLTVGGFLLAPAMDGQCREEDFRKLTSIELGNLRLSDIAYQSVSVDSAEAKDGMATYTVYMSLYSAHLVAFPDSTGQASRLTGSVSGSFRWKFTITGRSCFSISRIRMAPHKTNLVVRGARGISMPAMGRDANWNSQFIALTNEDPIDISNDAASGRLSLSAIGATLKNTSVILANGGAPAGIDFCSSSTASSQVTLDLNSGLVGGLAGTFSSCMPKNAIPSRVFLTAGNTIVTSSGFQSGPLTLVAIQNTLSLNINSPILLSPEVRLKSTSMPVAAVKTVRLRNLTIPLRSSNNALIGQPITSSQPTIEVDQREIIERVNDGHRIPDSLLPTGDATIGFVSAHTLRDTYWSLAQALNCVDRQEAMN